MLSQKSHSQNAFAILLLRCIGIYFRETYSLLHLLSKSIRILWNLISVTWLRALHGRKRFRMNFNRCQWNDYATNLIIFVYFVVATPFRKTNQYERSFLCKLWIKSLQTARTKERLPLHNIGNVSINSWSFLHNQNCFEFYKLAGISYCWLWYLSWKLELSKEFGLYSDIK